MRVLLIGPLPPPVGGTTASFAHLVDNLQDVHEIQLSVIQTFASKERTFKNKVLVPLRSLIKVVQTIPQNDIVSFHASTWRLIYFSPLLLMICRLFGRPLVVRAFGGSLDLAYSRCSWWQRLLIRCLFRSDKVLLQTKHLISHFQREFPRANLAWFPTSRPRSTSLSLEAQRREEGRRFVFLGHVKPSKGVRTLFAAVKHLRDAHFTLDIYGPLQEGVKYSEFKIDSKIKYKGVIEHNHAIPLLTNYDALIFPSQDEGEGYPGVILEAYMAGIPVIATRLRSILEIVEDGKNGLLTRPQDSDELAQAMQMLIDDPSLLATLKQGAKEQQAKFASDYWNKQVFVQLCRDVLASRKRTSERQNRESP